MTASRGNTGWVLAILESPRFATELTAASIGTAVFSFAIRQTIGWPGLAAVIAALVLLFGLTLWVRREEIEWTGLLPISLLVFVTWAGISVFWSQYQWVTLSSLLYLFAVTVLGVAIALLRDTIQVVRSFGNVLRVALIASLVLEVFAGLLIDSPIPFLSILGNLGEGGPVQGVFGTRNQLGVVALVAVVTFGTELRTQSVTRWVGIGSLALAGACLLFSGSPVAAGALIIVGVATLALFGLRRLNRARQQFAQVTILVVVVITGVVAWLFRTPIIAALDATGELEYRLGVWRHLWDLVPFNPLEGWGWIGRWRAEIFPFDSFAPAGGQPAESAFNAFFDVLFQLGWVGLFVFVGLLGLTFSRSWLLGSRERSFIYAWPALVLVALIACSLAESSILVEFGWLTLVICCVKAAQKLSWRQAFAASSGEERRSDSPVDEG